MKHLPAVRKASEGAETLQTQLSSQDKEAMLHRYMGLARRIAVAIARRVPSNVDRDDLVQEALIGLLEALNRYDPTRGSQVHTFANRRLRGAVVDSLRKLEWGSRGARRRRTQVLLAEETLSHRLGRRPSLKEIYDEIAFSQELRFLHGLEAARGQLASLDDPCLSGVVEELVCADHISDPSAQFEAESRTRDTNYDLWSRIQTLRPRQQLVLNLYYGRCLNLRQVGEVLGVSEARVCQIHAACLDKLRRTQRELQDGGASARLSPSG